MVCRSGFGKCHYQFVTNYINLFFRTYAIFPGSYMRIGTTGESSLPYKIKPISLSFFRKYLQKRKLRGCKGKRYRMQQLYEMAIQELRTS